MPRTLAIGLLLVVSCGPEGAADESSGPSSDADGDGSTSLPPTTSSTTASPESTSDASTSDASTSDAASTTGTTGEAWTWTADQTFSQTICVDGQPRLLIEIYPDQADGSCTVAADVDIDDIILIGADPWDGLGGTWILDEDGPVRAAVGPGSGPTTGTVTLEVDAPWSLVSARFELASDEGSAAGSAELAACYAGSLVNPCR